jgi:hypothetical protein
MTRDRFARKQNHKRKMFRHQPNDFFNLCKLLKYYFAVLSVLFHHFSFAVANSTRRFCLLPQFRYLQPDQHLNQLL